MKSVWQKKKGGDYEKATHHRAGGEGLSSRAHSIFDGHRHHLVYGPRPDSILNSNLLISRVRNLPQEVADFVFVHKSRHFATLPLCHIKDYSIGELQGYYLTVSIPVTMLLLEKNGWWRDKSNANAFIHPHLGSDNKIVFKDNLPVFHNVQIPYVHQLQNVLHEHNENISIHMQIFKI